MGFGHSKCEAESYFVAFGARRYKRGTLWFTCVLLFVAEPCITRYRFVWARYETSETLTPGSARQQSGGVRFNLPRRPCGCPVFFLCLRVVMFWIWGSAAVVTKYTAGKAFEKIICHVNGHLPEKTCRKGSYCLSFWFFLKGVSKIVVS